MTLHPCIKFCTFANLPLREQSALLDIQPEELHLKMQDPNFLKEAQLIDVREPEEVYVLIPLLFSLGSSMFWRIPFGFHILSKMVKGVHPYPNIWSTLVGTNGTLLHTIIIVSDISNLKLYLLQLYGKFYFPPIYCISVKGNKKRFNSILDYIWSYPELFSLTGTRLLCQLFRYYLSANLEAGVQK